MYISEHVRVRVIMLCSPKRAALCRENNNEKRSPPIAANRIAAEVYRGV